MAGVVLSTAKKDDPQPNLVPPQRARSARVSDIESDSGYSYQPAEKDGRCYPGGATREGQGACLEKSSLAAALSRSSNGAFFTAGRLARYSTWSISPVQAYCSVQLLRQPAGYPYAGGSRDNELCRLRVASSAYLLTGEAGQSLMNESLKKIGHNFSEVFPAITDSQQRKVKGKKIAAVLSDFLHNRKAATILDLGCSNCFVLDEIVPQLNPDSAVGVDVDRKALPAPTDKRYPLVADGQALPFQNETIDVVICNHVYEHVPDSMQLFDEIERVLKPEGIVYLSAMNLVWPIEPHHHLPFLHWMPRAMTRSILTGKGYPIGYVERPLSYFGLKKLCRRFVRQDYTLKIIREPHKFNAEELVSRKWGALLALVAACGYPFLPGFIWVLRKK